LLRVRRVAVPPPRHAHRFFLPPPLAPKIDPAGNTTEAGINYNSFILLNNSFSNYSSYCLIH
jgi:hypothetical protein